MEQIVCQMLTDPPMPGPVNMAIDEVLLETVTRTGSPILRFYTWSEPTLSARLFSVVFGKREAPGESFVPRCSSRNRWRCDFA